MASKLIPNSSYETVHQEAVMAMRCFHQSGFDVCMVIEDHVSSWAMHAMQAATFTLRGCIMVLALHASAKSITSVLQCAELGKERVSTEHVCQRWR